MRASSEMLHDWSKELCGEDGLTASMRPHGCLGRNSRPLVSQSRFSRACDWEGRVQDIAAPHRVAVRSRSSGRNNLIINVLTLDQI